MAFVCARCLASHRARGVGRRNRRKRKLFIAKATEGKGLRDGFINVSDMLKNDVIHGGVLVSLSCDVK